LRMFIVPSFLIFHFIFDERIDKSESFDLIWFDLIWLMMSGFFY
jgi:hypothetical protein